MPIKPNNTDKVKKSQQDEKHPSEHPGDVERDHGVTRYGAGQGADFNPDGDVTEPQEYKSGGLPRTDKYSVDKHAKI